MRIIEKQMQTYTDLIMVEYPSARQFSSSYMHAETPPSLSTIPHLSHVGYLYGQVVKISDPILYTYSWLNRPRRTTEIKIYTGDFDPILEAFKRDFSRYFTAISRRSYWSII